MRYVGLDVGRDFAHAAVVDDRGLARRLGRFRMGEEFTAFAATLGPGDVVALEASGNTWALAELLRRYAGKVVVSNPLRTRAIADAKRKTDDIDAATLAELLAADYLPEVWVPDEATRRLRRLVAHRAGLVRERTATRNRVTAILTRRLVRPPVTDPFGVRGRAWLAALDLPADERLALDSALRLDALLSEEIGVADRAIAAMVVDDERVRHLLTIPGIGLVTAAGILAVIGDIHRFARPAKLVSYLGLDPRIRQSGDRPAHGGHITRAGQAHARGLLTEAAHSAVRAPGPLASTYLRRAHGEVGASPSWLSPGSSPCSPGTCSRRTRTIATLGPTWCVRSTARSIGSPDARGQGRGRRNGERLVRVTTGVGQGCAARTIPITPPFARRSTASSSRLHPHPGLDTFIRRAPRRGCCRQPAGRRSSPSASRPAGRRSDHRPGPCAR